MRILESGQKGTEKLLARHGGSLLGVRYRYDQDARERLKAVELVVQGRPQEPEADRPRPRKHDGEIADSTSWNVALRIGWREGELRWRVKCAGGRWDPVRRVWILNREVAERLDLLDRVVGGGG